MLRYLDLKGKRLNTGIYEYCYNSIKIQVFKNDAGWMYIVDGGKFEYIYSDDIYQTKKLALFNGIIFIKYSYLDSKYGWCLSSTDFDFQKEYDKFFE